MGKVDSVREPEVVSRQKRPVFRITVKAIVIVVSAALAFRQVILLVEEYASFPTNTLYVIEDTETVRAPAFTICPKPSARANSKFSLETWKDEKTAKQSTIAEKFNDIFIPFEDLIKIDPLFKSWIRNTSTMNGETIMTLSQIKNASTINGETFMTDSNGTGDWRERTFYRRARNDSRLPYYKCLTMFLMDEMSTGGKPCKEYFIGINFNAITTTKLDARSAKVEVFVHDQREKFARLYLFEPENIVLRNNTVTTLLIRPEFIEKQNRWQDPCTLDEGYSYSRCMEKCFWKNIQLDKDLPCLNPSLLPEEAILLKPKCQDIETERKHLQKLTTAYENHTLLAYCNCPKRCKVADYHIFVDPSPACQEEFDNYTDAGYAWLAISFPSKRVPIFLEKEKVSLTDLLANIGGIIGICLGVSLVGLFEFIDRACAFIWRKLFPWATAVVDVVDKN
ncbi:unnamed protein product [Darwinula stevensoni]|uniref:Uncharacterized protein n=1 Tax=Darwinula stevensoni TaxID=69355 RepID=A0A7R8XD09_9CRUS|nr:unnamed protein product [Darwinula stevensoni]CAG0893853.1 unnamed protein product [Darwinula stevensoni]